LQSIINERIANNNKQWQDLIHKIGKAGPQNAAILDTENSIITKEDYQILVIDEELSRKLKFVKGGDPTISGGEKALKLIGDVVPVSTVEVIKKVRENRLRRYPLSAMELAAEVKKQVPSAHRSKVWQAIKENCIKDNPQFSVYNFRNKKQQDHYEETGEVIGSAPSIYNQQALSFLVDYFKRSSS